MGLQKQIEQDMRNAMKNREPKVNILKFIISEFQRRPNLTVEMTDNEVIALIRKFMKSYEETEKAVGHLTDEQKFEIEVLNEYLPKMASEEEIKKWILENIQLPDNPNARMKEMKNIMKQFAGRCDGNTVKNILMSM